MCVDVVFYSLKMYDTDFDRIFWGLLHLISCDMLCVTPCHVSNHGMRCLQYIPLARLKGGVLPPVLFNAFHFMLTTFTNHKSLFSLKEISAKSKQMRLL